MHILVVHINCDLLYPPGIPGYCYLAYNLLKENYHIEKPHYSTVQFINKTLPQDFLKLYLQCNVSSPHSLDTS
jgi:hypothetical protein